MDKKYTIDEVKVIELENLILDLAKVVEENRRLRKKLEQADKKKSNNIMNESVDFLDFSSRANNALHKAKIHTISDLCNKTYGDMIRTRGFGEKSLEELVKIMEVYDLHFAEEKEEFMW